MNDRALIYAAVLFRSLATGMMGVLLGIHLAQLSFDTRAIGLMVTLGLAGAALGTAFVTFFADHVGHRRSLLLVTALSVIGAVLLAFGTGPWLLGAAAFIGMVNGMGRDRGAALVLEQGALPATVSDAERTLTFARYNVLQDIGHALGSLLAAAPSLLEHTLHLEAGAASRGSMLIYGALMAVPLIAYARLSPAIESRRTELRANKKKPVLEVLNLLEAPERAATLACSNSITSLLSLEVNTKKPLRARRFSRINTLFEAPTNATFACSCSHSRKPKA